MVDVKHILTADLFHFMVDCRIPFAQTEPVDFVQASWDFMTPAFENKCRERAWPVLLELSRIGLDNMPDMMDFLPPPTDPDFAIQCLGLQIVLDQAPRALCSSGSTDGRYVNSYFDLISQRLTAAWLALPAAQRPDSWANRKGTMSFDYWILFRLWMGAPIAHNGTVKSQKRAAAFTEETRAVVEEVTGLRDPNRDDRDTIFSDVYAFPRMISEGPPVDEEVTAAIWSWWILKLMDVHKPIVDRFGRYPYRNAIRGLKSTDEEKEWIEKTDHFGEAPPEVAKKVKEDIAQGRWTPLGGS
ncbi:hypothetical protein DFH08DRAFT_843707 [Mycena albidolilacea]|uniref:Uncharacterized protein n=1 Tax=Mycena albidolilacea TaxID=1033008 RepID=A0AAD7AK90_9AGAR|nr:hypothetical protein DFH08DRAFT_843707 [Mycena albidolilacea]